MKPFLITLCAAFIGTSAIADPANPRTPAPIIFLSDNLGEPDAAGFCLDTQGRGRTNAAHVHSCKPNGGDVQFKFDDEGRIQSHAYPDLCLDLTDAKVGGGTFNLNTCSDAASQHFTFNTATAEIHPGEDTSLCVSVTGTNLAAGPFYKRDLVLSACTSTDSVLKSWSVRP